MPQYPYGPVNVNLGAVVSLSGASASGSSAVLNNAQGRGVTVFLDVASLSGTSPSFVPTIEGYDSVTGQSYTLLTGPSVTAAGTHVMQVYPGLASSAGAAADAVLPQQWQLAYTIGGTTPAVTVTATAVVQV